MTPVNRRYHTMPVDLPKPSEKLVAKLDRAIKERKGVMLSRDEVLAVATAVVVYNDRSRLA